MEPETSALLSSLNNQRTHVFGILDGLTEDALRRPVLPSGWTCLGMVQHLTISDERFWFRGIVAGEPVDLTTSEEAYATAWRVPPDVPTDAVFGAYRQEIELANAVIAATPLHAAPARWPDELAPTTASFITCCPSAARPAAHSASRSGRRRETHLAADDSRQPPRTSAKP